MLDRCESCGKLSKMVKTDDHFRSDNENTQRTLTFKHQECKHDKKKSTLIRKYFKYGNIEKWSDPTTDCWVCSFLKVFFSQQIFRKQNQNDS